MREISEALSSSSSQRDVAEDAVSARTVHGRFELQAARTPGALAAVDGETRATFDEVNRRANQLADTLRQLGVGCEHRVGILSEPCLDLVVSALAVLKAGAAFVPLDPNAPSERLAFVLQDAGAAYVLAPGTWRARLVEAGVRVLALDEPWTLPPSRRVENPGYSIDPDNLAYVIYTSGSTGRPKGVMVSHAGFTHYLDWCHAAYRSGGSGAPVHSSVAADLTLTSLFAPLMAGEPVVLMRQAAGVAALASSLRARRDFSFVKVTPTHLRLLARELAAPSPAADASAALASGEPVPVNGDEPARASTRVLIVGGEALYGEDLSFWRTHAPDTIVVNEYGPTETVVGCCVFETRAGDVHPGPQPIGRPIVNASLYVLDERLQPAAAGATGELYIGGAGMARGYLGRAGLTADRFLPDPFSAVPGARLYRTGDLATARADGTFEFLGRRDDQVKIHGYRVELGEIEQVLAEHADVESAVVAATTGSGDDRRLVAYVVGRPDRVPDVGVLRDFLAARLPPYMVPAAFMRLDRLSLLPSGKVDRRSLPPPDEVRPESASPYARPRSLEEEVLAGIWSQVLRAERVGIDDNYFVLGGDSIRTLQVVAQAKERGLTLSLDDVFQYPTIRELAAALRESQTAAPPPAVEAFAMVAAADRQLMPPDVVDAYPLSLLQAGMIYHMELRPDSAVYHDINSFHIKAPLDLDRLRQALGLLLVRHPILRTSFDLTTFSEALQLVHRSGELVLTVEDLRGLGPSEQDAAIAQWFEDEKQRGVGWSALPLIRFCVHLRGDNVWQFTISFHHAILDGWSEATMLAEAFQQYIALIEGRDTPFDPPAIQYRDFVRLERDALHSRETQAFWDARLEGHTFTPMPRWRPALPGRRVFLMRDVPIADDVSEGLKRAAMQTAVPIKDVLLAAHLRVISLLSGSSDVLTTVVSSGRPEHMDGERALGLFINSLPMRVPLTGGTWIDLAAAAFQAERDALPHRRYPMAELKWREGGRALSETLFYFTHFHVYEALQRFPEFTLLGGILHEHSSFSLGANCRIDPLSGRIYVSVKYDANQFPLEQIEQICGYYAIALTEIARNPLGRYDRIDLLAPQERRRLLVDWNAVPDEDPAGPSIVELFEAQVDRTPGAPIFAETHAALTYTELDQRANQLARHLRALGVAPETRVAVCLERSPSYVLAALAILKAGGAYVPLDPAYPMDRLAFLLADCAAPVVVTEQRLAARLPAHASLRVLVDEDWPVIGEFASTRLDTAVSADRVACVIYTSGSTGQPKGVECLHRGVTALVRDVEGRRPLPPGTRCSVWASVTFDGAIFELFTAVLTGGTLCFAPEAIRADAAEMSRWLSEERIQAAFGPPFMLGPLSDWAAAHPGSLALIRLVTGVESIDERLLSRIVEQVPGLTLLNTYGPTEAMVFSTAYHVSAEPGRSGWAPVGRAAKDRVFVLDEHQRLTPVGVAGEICISGPGLARGYLRRPGLTAERFIAHDCSGVPGARLYRTGDRGRYNADGNLEFLGRFDAQVKIRGYRVEPGEIEAALARHPGVRRAAVIVREDRPGDRQLAAYVERESDGTPTVRELRDGLKRRLPEYMVPSVFVFPAALPLTARDKVDRAALAAAPPASPEVTAIYEAPRTATEETLAGIWSHVLGVEAPGIHDNFFELGGHSLLATRLVATVRDAFQVPLPLAALVDAPTIAELGAAVTSALAAGAALPPADASLPVLVPDPLHRHDPFPLTDVQQAYWIGRNEAFELGDLASHGYLEFDVQGLDLGRLTRAIQRLIARHDMLRAIVLPDGRQRVLPDVPPYEIDSVDLRGLPPADVEARIASLRERMSRHTFRPHEWPLFEIRAHRLDGDRTRLHFSIDPVTTDADSMGLMSGELARLYADGEAPLEPLEITFRDYVLGELALRGSDRYQAARAYWMDRIASLPPAPELPAAPRDGRAGGQFARLRTEIEPAVWKRLKTRAARRGLTPSGLLLAAYAEVLANWSASARFTVNVTTYGALPLHPQIPNVVGDFTTLTLVEVDSRGPTFEARARTLQRQFLEDLEHASFSGIQLLRELARRRNDALRAAMPVVFTSTLPLHARAGDRQPMLTGTLVTGITQTPQTLLDHQVSESGGALTVRWDYLAAAFPPDVVRDMFQAYCAWLEALAAPDEAAWTRRPHAFALPATQQQVRASVNATTQPRVDEALHAGVVRQIAARPEATAIATPSRTLSYATLGREAAAVATALQARGVGAELVAVVMEKGWEQVVAVLGILEAGAAYLPIDASWPQARQWDVLHRGQVRVVVTQPSVDSRLAWPDGIARVVVHAGAEDDRALTGTCRAPDARAYVIFTSGSTGQPKGVVMDHASTVNTVRAISERWRIGPEARVFGVSALSFDLSVYDIFGTLGAGGTLVLPAPEASRDPDAWLAQADATGVTVWNSVPALFEMLVAAAASRGSGLPASLRLALLSGDWIPVTLPARARALRPDLEVVSLGGATEAAIWSIAYPIGAASPAWASIPYGLPLPNQTWRILDRDGAPSPDWVPGDLYIGGAGLAQGYWREPAMTASSFVPEAETGGRLYRTGDRGRYWPDGTIEFLGRTDAQVKVHGHRIELGEIQAALAQHPAVRQAEAAAIGPRQGPKRLVAYVALRDNGAAASPDAHPTNGSAPGLLEGPMLDELRKHLATRLPDYMVPKTFVRLETMPLTSNGKVDRDALPVPEGAASARLLSEASYRAPQTDVERLIAAIWQDLLNVDRVGLDDSFLILGGHSLLALELVARLRTELSVKIPLRAVFEDPTLDAMASLVARERAAAADEEGPSADEIEAALAAVESLSGDEARARLGWPQSKSSRTSG